MLSQGLIKSIHGGGGKGTAHLHHPDNEEEVPFQTLLGTSASLLVTSALLVVTRS